MAKASWLLDAIIVIESQKTIDLLRVADWPNMKKSSREKLYKQLFKRAYPASFKKAKVVSPQEMARLLGG